MCIKKNYQFKLARSNLSFPKSFPVNCYSGYARIAIVNKEKIKEILLAKSKTGLTYIFNPTDYIAEPRSDYGFARSLSERGVKKL